MRGFFDLLTLSLSKGEEIRFVLRNSCTRDAIVGI